MSSTIFLTRCAFFQRVTIELMQMLNASIAGRYDDVGINRVDRGAQSFERIGGPVGKRTLDGMRDEKCMALGWTDCRNRAAYLRQSDGKTCTQIPSIRVSKQNLR